MGDAATDHRVTPRAFTLTIPLPTSTVNAERAGDKWAHRRATQQYREAAYLYARQARLPRLDRIAVEATPFGPRIRQDVGACLPSVKAAIDGLVDAHVVPDDTPVHVCRLTFHAPRRGDHGLHLLVIDLADLPPDHGTFAAKLALEV